MKESQKLLLYRAAETIDELLVRSDVADAVRAPMQSAVDRIKEALHIEEAWPPPPTAHEWVVKPAQCRHENVFPTEPGNLMGSLCSVCSAPLAGAKAVPRIKKAN